MNTKETERVASVGDVICCKVQNPFPQTLRVTLSTPEACAYGNELIASGRWQKERDSGRYETIEGLQRLGLGSSRLGAPIKPAW